MHASTSRGVISLSKLFKAHIYPIASLFANTINKQLLYIIEENIYHGVPCSFEYKFKIDSTD